LGGVDVQQAEEACLEPAGLGDGRWPAVAGGDQPERGQSGQDQPAGGPGGAVAGCEAVEVGVGGRRARAEVCGAGVAPPRRLRAPCIRCGVSCRGVALFPRELAKILDRLRRLRDPNRPRALDAIEAALVAIGLAELAKRQQQTIDDLTKKLWETQQELARYKASIPLQLAAEDMERTAQHISEWERELRD
jgi:hypothetical protein